MTLTTKTKLLPLGNRLVLRRVESDSVAGVRMPDVAGEDRQSQECEVVATPFGGLSIGTSMAAVLDKAKSVQHMERMSMQTVINIGDHVYIARHEGYTVQTNSGEELVVIDAEKVLCVEVDEAEVATV